MLRVAPGCAEVAALALVSSLCWSHSAHAIAVQASTSAQIIDAINAANKRTGQTIIEVAPKAYTFTRVIQTGVWTEPPASDQAQYRLERLECADDDLRE